MKKLLVIFLAVIALNGTTKAQDFSDIPQVEIKKFAEFLASGTSAMTWTSAGAPSAFGLKVGLFGAAGTVPEMQGAKDIKGIMPNNLGLWVSAGTMGFEGVFRILPTDYVNLMGFGLKYEATSLIPLPPGLPLSISGYFDYHKLVFGNDEKTGKISNTNTSIGALVGGKLLFITLYGRLGFETGTTNFIYTYVEPNTQISFPFNFDEDSGGMRMAVGGSLSLFDFEVGTRGGLYYAFGVSLGI